ncbi:5285_t:CDS:2, partial [Paraglomus occultum]
MRSAHTDSAYKDWLDKTVEDGAIKSYSDDDITERVLVKRNEYVMEHKAVVKNSGLPVMMRTLSFHNRKEDGYKDLVRESSTSVLIHSGVAKIGDFGSSCIVSQITVPSNSESNSAYVDPVSFKDYSYKLRKESDVFSLGVILWEISSGKIPCEQLTADSDIIIYRLNGFYDKPFPGTPTAYVELYSKCWDEDPEKRPASEDVYLNLESLLQRAEERTDQDHSLSNEQLVNDSNATQEVGLQVKQSNAENIQHSLPMALNSNSTTYTIPDIWLTEPEL